MTRPRAVKRAFKPRARQLKDWARDQVEMSRAFFGTQTPLFAIAKSLERDPQLSKAVRVSLSKELHRRVKFTNEVPKGWRCVALSVVAEESRCSRCGEAAKKLKTNFQFLDRGQVVPPPELHATPAVCPGCGHVEEPEDSVAGLPGTLPAVGSTNSAVGALPNRAPGAREPVTKTESWTITDRERL